MGDGAWRKLERRAVERDEKGHFGGVVWLLCEVWFDWERRFNCKEAKPRCIKISINCLEIDDRKAGSSRHINDNAAELCNATLISKLSG